MPITKGEYDRLWSVILAGGNGERVKPMVQRWLGRETPKQYCAFVGTRSMFQHTLDRATRLTPSERMVTVIARQHWEEAVSQLEKRASGTLLLQPANRDTAAGIFLPLTYIRSRDPHATVVVFPSDHFVYPEDRFLDVVQRAVFIATRMSNHLLLLGVRPDRLEREYGWMELDESPAGLPHEQVRTVLSFIEKPNAEEAIAAFQKGALWNTLVCAGTVDAFWRLGWQCFPTMMPLFERLESAIHTSDEARVLEAIYQDMPAGNFSTGLLQQASRQVVALELTGVLWSDWGKPERIAETLRQIDRRPAFPLDCLNSPIVPMAALGTSTHIARSI